MAPFAAAVGCLLATLAMQAQAFGAAPPGTPGGSHASPRPARAGTSPRCRPLPARLRVVEWSSLSILWCVRSLFSTISPVHTERSRPVRLQLLLCRGLLLLLALLLLGRRWRRLGLFNILCHAHPRSCFGTPRRMSKRARKRNARRTSVQQSMRSGRAGGSTSGVLTPGPPALFIFGFSIRGGLTVTPLHTGTALAHTSSCCKTPKYRGPAGRAL